MKKDEKKKNRKINFEVKRVYVGKKPIGEVFEEVIEHIVERNLEDNTKEKHTQA
ncbi:TPA: recombinase RecR [Clostridioides difficile]|uniref:recombinase RecR n=1 Tax=Clostridia TaxID=186801 RepID=UPI000AB5A38B|nr:recombinase RecR [Clostridioides difficile]MDU4953682.1 recombinase RecR [Clostridium sp.]MCJ0177829.1 recombinase RecR [Clostridioides difficile]HBF6354657.1 recombinase RecR [Clostridioides difficile]HBF6558767.1 recombinase RecR [Clostridioides difficile]HBF7123110.1 recombinase RecR [Clostridioides difficile]